MITKVGMREKSNGPHRDLMYKYVTRLFFFLQQVEENGLSCMLEILDTAGTVSTCYYTVFINTSDSFAIPIGGERVSGGV